MKFRRKRRPNKKLGPAQRQALCELKLWQVLPLSSLSVKAVKSLEKQDFVEKIKDDDDARKKRVKLTKWGRRRVLELRDPAPHELDEAFAREIMANSHTLDPVKSAPPPKAKPKKPAKITAAWLFEETKEEAL